MKTSTCKGCKHLRQYETTKMYFCANSVKADASLDKSGSIWPFQVKKQHLDFVSCDSWEPAEENK